MAREVTRAKPHSITIFGSEVRLVSADPQRMSGCLSRSG
jgi:hypothetical protein